MLYLAVWPSVTSSDVGVIVMPRVSLSRTVAPQDAVGEDRGADRVRNRGRLLHRVVVVTGPVTVTVCAVFQVASAAPSVAGPAKVRLAVAAPFT